MYRRDIHVSDGFEVSQEVLNQRADPDFGPILMDEGALSGLTPCDVSHHPYQLLKRMVDAVGSFIGLLILLIPFCIVALLIFVDDPGPVFFRQHRVGFGGKRFRVYKFRSMKVHTPKYMSSMEVEDPQQYVTRIGKWLRRMSIDELPQLFNVLIGDMSFVGPRPLISDEYEIHKLRMKYGVYSTRPGITGLAQIHGREKVMPMQKVQWDVKYVNTFGLWTDMRILLKTIPVLLGCLESAGAKEYNSTGRSA